MITRYRIRLGLVTIVAVLLVAGLALSRTAYAQEGDQPFIGIRIENTEDGALVVYVMPDSPASDADLQEGDLITRIDELDITAEATLAGHMEGYAPGDVVTLYLERNGEPMGVELTLGTATMMVSTIEPPMMPPAAPPMMPPVITSQVLGDRGYLGVSYRTLSPDEDEGEGALIVEVVEDSPAAEAGLEVDDIITAVNDEPVDEERTLSDRIYPYETGDTVTLTVLRGEETLTQEVTLGAPISIAVIAEGQPMPMPAVPEVMPAPIPVPGMPVPEMPGRGRGQLNPRQGTFDCPWGHHGMHHGPMHQRGFHGQGFMEQHPGPMDQMHEWMQGWMEGLPFHHMEGFESMMPHHMEGYEGMMPHHMEGFEGMMPHAEEAAPAPAEPGSSY